MNDNNPVTAAELPPHVTSTEAFETIAAMLDRRGKAGLTPEIRAMLDGLGAVWEDHSEADASIEEAHVLTGDGLVTVTYGDTPTGRGFAMHRYQHVDRRSWEY